MAAECCSSEIVSNNIFLMSTERIQNNMSSCIRIGEEAVVDS